MKKWIKRLSAIGATAVLAASNASASGVISLFEYAFNIDGTVTNGLAPSGVSLAGFNTSTGLGSISVSLTGAGSRYVSLFVDHEIDETTNTFYNENGSTSGSAASGQSWEIDEPGFGTTYTGDIYGNFVDGALDNAVGTVGPDDVSMAMAFGFTLGAGQTGLVEYFLSTTAPTGGFYLWQNDPDSQASVYLSSRLTIRDTGPQPTPEPASIALVGLGLLGMWKLRRRRVR